jgi:hypothetical protein
MNNIYISKKENLLYLIKTLPLNSLKFIWNLHIVFIPNCIVIGGNNKQNIILTTLDTEFEYTGNAKKNIIQYINKLIIIAILVFSKKL